MNGFFSVVCVFWFNSGSAGIVVFNYKDCNNMLQKTEAVFYYFLFFRQFCF